jgi:hypothetical protein
MTDMHECDTPQTASSPLDNLTHNRIAVIAGSLVETIETIETGISARVTGSVNPAGGRGTPMGNAKAIWILYASLSAGNVCAQEVFLQGGTQGVGLGAALNVNPSFGLHADFNGLNFSHNFTIGGNLYEDEVHLRQGGVYGDFFPWSASGFRLTGGLRLTDDHLTAVSTPSNGMYEFQGKLYPAYPGESATAEVRYPTAMPYLGIGYGHQSAARGLGFIADLGVAYGIPQVSYTLSPTLERLAGPAMSSDIAATGLQELKQKVSPYRWYPTVQIGVSYRF